LEVVHVIFLGSVNLQGNKHQRVDGEPHIDVELVVDLIFTFGQLDSPMQVSNKLPRSSKITSDGDSGVYWKFIVIPKETIE